MKRTVLWLLISTFAAVSLLLAADVKVDYKHSANFSKYNTYSWLDVKAGNPLWVDRIRMAVDTQLGEKGWMQVPSGGMATVSAFGSSQNQPQLQTYYNTLGGGWFWNGFGDGIATTTVQNMRVGTLVVDIFDTPSKQLIWRGVASDAVSDNPEKNEKRLDKAVSEMFKKFPPAPKG